MAEADETPAEQEAADDQGPELPAEAVGAVETADGTEHVGVLPASAAEQPEAEENRAARTGWFRSPGGVLAHADGPSQVRAYTDRGYTEVDDATAKAEIGDGITLTVDRSSAKGTFDDDAVKAAVRNEAATPRKRAPRKRTAAKPATPPAGTPPEG